MSSRRGLAWPNCKARFRTTACFCSAPPLLSGSNRTDEAVDTICCIRLPSCRRQGVSDSVHEQIAPELVMLQLCH